MTTQFREILYPDPDKTRAFPLPYSTIIMMDKAVSGKVNIYTNPVPKTFDLTQQFNTLVENFTQQFNTFV